VKHITILIALVLGLCGLLCAATIQELITSGDLAAVKTAIDGDPGLLSSRLANGQTLLHTAAYNGKLEIAKYLIDKGADVNARSASASAPLHGAALYGHEEVVRLLISKGADPNAANASGFTPVINAATGGTLATLRALIDAGGSVRARTSDGTNILMYAIRNGKQDVVRLLITAGVPLDETDGAGSTAIHYAAVSGDTALIRLCVQAGLPIDRADTSGQTPFHFACSGAKIDAMRLLLDLGANLNATDHSGENAVNKVIYSGFQPNKPTALYEAIPFLASKGIDVNHQNNYGYTPLLFAINMVDTVIINQLVSAGADINLVGGDATPPLITVVMQHPAEYIPYWLKKGVNQNARSPHTGETALHTAVLRGDLAIVQELLKSTHDVNAVDNNGRTPLGLAEQYDHKQIAQALRAKGAKRADAEKATPSYTQLRKASGDNQAAIWYLLGCGYAVKTKNHLLVFDYIQGPAGTTEPSLSNGRINPAELAGENVYAFISHEHGDHYEANLWSLQSSIPGMTCVLGFRPEQLAPEARQGYVNQPYEYIGPRSSRTIGDMQVRTIRANDAGVGFVINVDGLTIYHAGDHAGWLPGQRDGYTAEIDSIAAAVGTVDIAFVNVTGCHVRDTLALAEGTRYTISKLSPKLVVPTHAYGNEYYYSQFVQKLRPGNPDVLFFCPQYRGDVVRFAKNGNKGKIEAL
jgi:ankyrin repeat protein/L-ascorbate metabolism protein UlaG (beta-lactamase superfamily)